jgi:cytochrome c-type biogenesis protein CcmF
VGATAWIMLATLRAAYNMVSNKEGGISLNQIGRSQLGMLFAHFGIAVSVMGATIVSNYSIEKSVRMGPGISQELAGYTFKYLETKNVVGPNYTAKQGQIEIYKDDEFVSLLKPDRRQYTVRTMDMTEAGIDWGLFRDLYVTMGDPISLTEFAVRLNYKPFVRWIWFGSIFMMIGGFLAASDKRYRVKQVASEDVVKAKLATV